MVDATTAILLREFLGQNLVRMTRWSLLLWDLRALVHHVRGR
jgi:hypothetical protein